MLLASRQCHPTTAQESAVRTTLGRLFARTAVAHAANTTLSADPFTRARPSVSAGKTAPEAGDVQKSQSSFWQGEPIQPKPAAPAGPAEELAIWEACEYLRRFVRDNWGEGAEHAAVIECGVPIARIREFGRLPERQGTRSCTRLVRIPVLAEEIGHRLWKLLSQEIAHEALEIGQEGDHGTSALLGLDTDWNCGRDQDMGRFSVVVERPRYKQCWICHGQSKYQEVEEAVGTMTSCYRCMECFHRFEVKTTMTSLVVGSSNSCTTRKTTLPERFGRVFNLRRGVTKSMPELRQRVDPAKSSETRGSFEGGKLQFCHKPRCEVTWQPHTRINSRRV